MPFDSHSEAIEEHRAFLRRVARELLSDDHAAEDVVQEVALAWWARPPRSAEAARAWLACVTRNLALNARRDRERRDARETLAARTEGLPCSAEIDASLGAQRRVLEAVLALREPYKTVVWLRWYEDLPPRAIARRTGRSVETVKSQLKRALAELRTRLDGEFGDRRAWSLALLPMFRRTPVPLATMVGLAALVGCLGLALVIVLGIAPGEAPAGADTALRSASALPSEVGEASDAHPASLHLESPPVREPATTPQRFRGRALDAYDGAPLPELDVVTHCTDGSVAHTRTALDGTFEVPLSAGARLKNVEFLEGETVAITGEGRDALGVAEFTLAIGPTLALEFARLGGVAEDLHAALTLPGSDDRPVAGRLRGGARAERPWVRFPRSPELSLFGAGERSMYVLEVSRADGLARALARVHARGGTHPRSVRLALEPCGVVRGRVATPSGTQRRGARIVLTGAGTLGERASELDDAGGFEFARVAPGRTRVELISNILESTVVEVEVRVGEVTEVELAPTERPLGFAMIHMRSATTDHPLPDLPLARRRGTTKWTSLVERGSVTAPGRERLAVLRASDGPYELAPPAYLEALWEPQSALVHSRMEGATFTLRDDLQTERVTFHARSRDGAPIGRFRAHVLFDRLGRGRAEAVELDGAGFVREGCEGVATFEKVAAGARGWWLVETEGFQSAWGTLDDLDRAPGERSSAVVLAPAWKCSLEFVGRGTDGSKVALHGVNVSTKGGRLLATSLGDGRVEMELCYDPGTLSVELDGWRVTHWAGFSSGKRRALLDLHEVELERDR